MVILLECISRWTLSDPDRLPPTRLSQWPLWRRRDDEWLIVCHPGVNHFMVWMSDWRNCFNKLTRMSVNGNPSMRHTTKLHMMTVKWRDKLTHKSDSNILQTDIFIYFAHFIISYVKFATRRQTSTITIKCNKQHKKQKNIELGSDECSQVGSIHLLIVQVIIWIACIWGLKKRAINNLKAVQEDLVSQGVGGDEFQGFTFFYSSL